MSTESRRGRKVGHLVLEETRKKISAANKGSGHKTGVFHTQETKRKISLGRIGLHHTQETKRKISLGRKGKSLTTEQVTQRKIEIEMKEARDAVALAKWGK
jgi:hypothetical protein